MAKHVNSSRDLNLPLAAVSTPSGSTSPTTHEPSHGQISLAFSSSALLQWTETLIAAHKIDIT